MAIWVDDGLVCSNHRSKLDDIMQFLSNQFDMTSEPAGCFVGIQIVKETEKRRSLICTKQRTSNGCSLNSRWKTAIHEVFPLIHILDNVCQDLYAS
jgi:hypothetical protein